MRLITAADSLQGIIAGARNGGASLTNFFPDPFRIREWCAASAFMTEKAGETFFFIHRQTGFDSVYFMTPSPEALSGDLKNLLRAFQGGKVVADVVGPDSLAIPLVQSFSSNGFHEAGVLQRMGRRTPSEQGLSRSIENVSVASGMDCRRVFDCLQKFFDPKKEQLPSYDEILHWQSKREVLVSKDGKGGVNAFIIYNLMPASLYLRYWFVSPEARGAGVGSGLMRSMFAAAKDTRRQYLWVFIDNERAVARYRHYGFRFEPVKDYVMLCGQ